MTIEQKTLEAKVLMGQATEEEMGALGLDRVLSLKSDPERAQFRDHYPAEDFQVKAVGDRTYRYTFSAEAPDRVGDVLKVDGWVLKNFRRNPVALWGHDGRTRPPVGLARNLSTKAVSGSYKALEGDIQLAPEGTSQFTDELHRFVEAGIVKATSVGVRILKTEKVGDKEERERMGLGPYGILSTKHELLEISLVSVPMHQDALRRSVDEMLSAGTVSKAGADDILSAILVPEEYEETTKSLGLLRDYVRIEWVPQVAKLLGEDEGDSTEEKEIESDPVPKTEQDEIAKDDPLLAEVRASLDRLEERSTNTEAKLADILARVSALAENTTKGEQAEGHADDSGGASNKASGSDAEDEDLAQATAVRVLLAGLSTDVEKRLKGRVKPRCKPGEG